jgi:hypothetical protein
MLGGMRGQVNESREVDGVSKGLLAIAVGTLIAECPPHGPGRALISASGSYLG